MRLSMTASRPDDARRSDPASPVRDPPPVSDAMLVARVLADDDRHAFAELVRRHQSGVRSVLRRLTKGSHALADDLGQETFLQVYRNLRQFRGEARFSTWVYRIAYNRFLAHVRAAHPEDQLPEDLQAITANDAGDEAALKIDLERALARLSVAERAAIVHCYYQDLSHEEAAYVLGCPLGTVKTNILRGRQKLRALLAAWAPAAGHEESKR
jgi:RNA polymerase sigma-70 factor (ECF subfamily)